MPSNPFSSKLAIATKHTQKLDLEYNRAVRNAARSYSLYEAEFLHSEQVRALINGPYRFNEEALPSLRAECRRACMASEAAWEDREASKAKAAGLLEELKLARIEVEKLQAEVDGWARDHPGSNSAWSFSQLFDALPIFGVGGGSRAKVNGESKAPSESDQDSQPDSADTGSKTPESTQGSSSDSNKSSPCGREESYHSLPTQTPPQPVDDPQAAIEAFHLQAQQCFRDYTRILEFPEPPVTELCVKDTCMSSQDDRLLLACPCNIRAAFEGKGNLRIIRAKWHPDRFRRCREDLREDLQGKAKEVFVVLNQMYEEGFDRES
ncbi:hypothetical protein Tdes44962_MAKER05518 [Teratosphaeria destructans]|uniref:Uncharacterized protein n=1 Tax=Teratosphaeria destructans TaxID=418781 RepID=A0A9W7SJS5_9PEZI|nr:hypothetical protein Tdes44962_MAKER05518 [Teratosphaeria destructans]